MEHESGNVYSGSLGSNIGDGELAALFTGYLKKIGPRRKVLAIPPDGTRAHAKSAVLLKAAYDFYGDALAGVMPALGTHRPMREAEAADFFPGIPFRLFLGHDWRNDLVTIGTVPAEFVSRVSGGACTFDWPAQINARLAGGGWDLILSLGQVVPHEVVGMANYSKNILIGTGGRDAIGKSHWLGAACGIERVLGRIDTPVRAVLDYAQDNFLSALPIAYALTVIGQDPTGSNKTIGFYAGTGRRVFEEAAGLSARANITRLPAPAKNMLVWLDPAEFKSTWLGNKAIYRTRLAMADGGRLVIIAPGIDCFGEDRGIDETIRKFGYRGLSRTKALVDDGTLAHDLAGAAHLAHGSTEGRFSVSYAPAGLSRAEVEAAGYEWADCQDMIRKYNPAKLRDGPNEINGESVWFVRNPALGLWSSSDRP